MMADISNKGEEICVQENISNNDNSDDSDRRKTIRRRTAVAAESIDIGEHGAPVSNFEIHPKSDEQRKFLKKAVNEIVLFSQLDEANMSAVIDAMFEFSTTPGQKVITEGEEGDNFYVIASGNFDIYIKGKKFGAYHNSGSFGELALLYNTERAATVVSLDHGRLWAMSRKSFRQIVLTHAYKKRQTYEHLLNSVALFHCLSPYERTNVSEALTSRIYQDGEVIIKEGDPGKEMYFIEEGGVRIVKTVGENTKEVKRLKKNEYFGELALHTQKPRAASVYAIGKTMVAVLPIESFERLLGPCMQILKRDMETYNAELERIRSDQAKMF